METKIDYADALARHPKLAQSLAEKLRKGKSKSKGMAPEDCEWKYSWAQRIVNDPEWPDPDDGAAEFVSYGMDKGYIKVFLVLKAGRSELVGDPEEFGEGFGGQAPAEICASYDPGYGSAAPEWAGPVLKIWQPEDGDRPGLALWAVAGIVERAGERYAVATQDRRLDPKGFSMLRLDAQTGVAEDGFEGAPAALAAALLEGKPLPKSQKAVLAPEDPSVFAADWKLETNADALIGQLSAMGGFAAFGQPAMPAKSAKAAKFAGAPAGCRKYAFGEGLSAAEKAALRSLDNAPAAFGGADLFSVLAQKQASGLKTAAMLKEIAMGRDALSALQSAEGLPAGPKKGLKK